MQSQVADFAHAYFLEVWNERNDAAMERYLAPDFVEHGISEIDAIPMDLADFRRFRRRFLDTFPDCVFHIEDIVSEGDSACIRFRVDGTHLGDAFGGPATGNRMSITGLTFVKVRNGKFVESWDNYDKLQLMRQIGLVA
ncbi:MAG: ester cyclase [Fimbriimonadaceae bacterium]|nr:ester cyclase [Fimbriimonadaceae bacterium]